MSDPYRTPETPHDSRPLHPVYNVPVNSDGSLDLSGGLPLSNAEREGLHIAVAQALASIDAADSDAKRERILDEILGALKVVALLLPPAVSGGLIPAGIAATAGTVLPLVEELVRRIEDR